ncbi:MAG: CRISPR-associated protein Cas4 [Nitrososphaeria archaeon]
MVQYYVACKRELWFFGNKINMDYESDDIKTGKIIHQTSYPREDKEIEYEGAVFDFVRNDNGVFIFEIKKSSRLREPVKYQLYYYLWYALKNGTRARGIIVYPKERKREQIELDDAMINNIQSIVADIPNVISMKNPPPPIKKPYCRGCAYYNLCWV